jgi:hypothetical protein
MLFLFISVIILGLLLCGAGCLFGRMIGFNSARNPWIYFWLGFFVISSLSMFVSLFVPVNLSSLIVFCIIGTIGFPFFYREYRQVTAQCNKTEKKIYKYVLFLFFVFMICISAYTRWPGWAYDTDLYHAQIVRWHNEYGTPPGLGNLHARLAFNSSWLSLAALFDNGIWDSRSAWLMPALAFIGGGGYFLYELFFARQNGIRLYAVCILAWLWFELKLSYVVPPSLYYDDPVHVLNAVIVLEAYYLLSGHAKNISSRETCKAANLLLLSVSAFTIKPISAVSLLFSGLLTLFLLIRNAKNLFFHGLKYIFLHFAPSVSG